MSLYNKVDPCVREEPDPSDSLPDPCSAKVVDETQSVSDRVAEIKDVSDGLKMLASDAIYNKAYATALRRYAWELDDIADKMEA